MNRLSRRFSRLLVLAACSVLLSACANTKLTQSWTKEELRNAPYRNFLIIGISGREHNRRLFEQHFADELRKRGIGAEESYTMLPESENIDRDTVAEAIAGKNIDAVLVTHMLSIEEETVYRQDLDYRPTLGYYNGLYNYYPRVHTYVNQPGYYTTHEIVKLETNVYDVESEDIIWSAQSRTFEPESAAEVIRDLTRLVISDLSNQGVIE